MGMSVPACALSGVPVRNALVRVVASKDGEWLPLSLPARAELDDYSHVWRYAGCDERHDPVLATLTSEDESAEAVLVPRRVRHLATQVAVIESTIWYALAGLPFGAKVDAESWLRTLPTSAEEPRAALPLDASHELYGEQLAQRPLAIAVAAAVARTGARFGFLDKRFLHVPYDSDQDDLEEAARALPRVPHVAAIFDELRKAWFDPEGEASPALAAYQRACHVCEARIDAERAASAQPVERPRPPEPPVELDTRSHTERAAPPPAAGDRFRPVGVRRDFLGRMVIELHRQDRARLAALLASDVRTKKASKLRLKADARNALEQDANGRWTLSYGPDLRAELDAALTSGADRELESLPGVVLAFI